MKTIKTMSRSAKRYVKKKIPLRCFQIKEPSIVKTRTGMAKGEPGDYLIEGATGDLYFCKKEVFEVSYEKYKEG